jgi:hypothetical protein
VLIAMASKKVPARFAEREDVITSTILGPLRYWDAARVWDVLQCLIGPSDHEFPTRPDGPIDVDVRFWPRAAVGTGYCEPDLVVDLFVKTPDTNKILVARIIVEVKWNAGASGKHQLALQHDAFGRQDERLIHVYLTKHHDRAASDIQDAGPKAAEVINLPWSSLVSRVEKVATDPVVQRWAEDVLVAMARLGVLPFSGFRGLDPLPAKLVSFAFFSSFNGFDQMVKATPRCSAFHFWSATL